MVAVDTNVISREPFTATDMAFLFAATFSHLQDVQYAVIFYLEKHHELPVGFAQLVQIVEYDFPDVFRKNS